MSEAELKTVAQLIPLRDVVVFPFMVTPLFVGREKSISSLNAAMEADKKVVLVSQRDADVDAPAAKDLFEVGTLAKILQMLKLPDGTVKVLVEGEQRVAIESFSLDDGQAVGCVYTELESKSDPLTDAEMEKANLDVGSTLSFEEQEQVLSSSLLNVFESYVKLNKKLPSEVSKSVNTIDAPGRLADSIAAHLSIKVVHKQPMLECLSVLKRLSMVLDSVEAEIELLEVEKRVRGRVRNQMEKSQREYYLNEQMKAIQREIDGGDEGEEGESEFDRLSKDVNDAGMPKAVRTKADAELKKLKLMSPMSAEATVVRSYIDWLLAVPWKKRSKVRRDLRKAEEILDQDHYGLEKVKERILEYLAVQQRVRKMKGPILCLVGPPGVGKTSLGESIAKATNRKFQRIALGGVRDEAEIRGHRRTYIGALPGKVIQQLAKAETKNPLILLDEIDKMAADFRGDPGSALLEVLDPEQNHSFNDHYLEVDTDLSDVMFICTANSMNIPHALLDRMEVIRLSGYTEEEKLNIAMEYLLPKQISRNGLKENEAVISSDVVRHIVRHYSREAGVRGLERELAKLCRKVLKSILDKSQTAPVEITVEKLENLLGVERYSYGKAEDEDRVGQVIGLAWTEVGGELLTIEAASVVGKGTLIQTGQLGDVMKESVTAAMTVVRSRASSLGLADDFHQKLDIHIHVPEGATPKDGPSAGVGMCTALVSSLTGIPVRAEVAMTGEITLRGEVLPIGGLKEKLLAAHRGGITKVLIPNENVKDLIEIPENVKELVEIVPVKWIDQVFEHALTSMPVPRVAVEAAAGDTASESKGSVSVVSRH
jgi:ATP-dependent Lon protease